MRNLKIITLLVAILIIPTAIAQPNDPGHDSLYVLKDGDTITGDLEVTGDITAQQVWPQQRLFMSHLRIRGDGEIPGGTSKIYGLSNELYLSSPEIFINYGDGGDVRIGSFGDPAAVHIIGDLTVDDTDVCLSDGTNCLINLTGELEGTLSVSSGGTGTSSLDSDSILIGGTSSVNFLAPGSSGSFVRSTGSTWTSSSIQTGDIPNLNADKITSGEFAVARIPDLSTDKITSGILVPSRGGTGVSSCSAGQVLIWDLGEWTCGTVEDSGGTITQIDTGDGILGGPITDSGEISLDTEYTDELYLKAQEANELVMFPDDLGIAYDEANDELVIGNISAFT